MDEDEDSRLFLRMLDAVAERIFIEACSEVKAEEISEVSVECNTETRHPSTRKLCSEWSLRNTVAPLSQGSSSPIESQQRRKRPRTSVQQQRFPASKISLRPDEKAQPSIVAWPQNFTAHGFGVGKSVHVLESKKGLSLGKNSDQPVWKTDFRLQRNLNNAGSTECYGGGLPWAVLAPMARLDGKSETEDTEKSDDDFSKEIHDAICRIESLIPSLQKLVTSVQTPIDHKNIRSLEMQNVYSSSTLGDAPANVLGKAKEIARNELDDANKISEGSTKVVQIPGGGKSLTTSLAGNQHLRLKQVHQAKGNANFFRKEFEGSKEGFNEAMTEKGATCLSAERDYCCGKIGKSQVRGQDAQARMDRVESLRRTSGRNESVTISSRTPEHVSGLRRYIPCQCSKNVIDQEKAISKQAALQAHGASRYQTSVSSVGSSSFRRPKTSSKFDSSNYKGSPSHAKERMMHHRDSAHRNNSLRRKSINSASRNMITLQNQISEETSSFASTGGTSTQQSGYPTSLTGSYQSSDSHYSTGSDETVEGYWNFHHDQSPSRKWSGSSSASYTGYETSSNYSSQDQYSDTGASSQRSSDRPHRTEHHGPKVGRISKIRRKLGKVFHHHHHHHHHHKYSDRDEPDVVHASFFSRLGKIFQRTDKSDRKRLKAEKSHEPVSKIVAKKKQHGSHFRTLVDGLRRHMKHSKKTKKAKDDIGRLAGDRRKGKRAKQKLPLWPKMGKGKAKLPNKGNFKFGTKKRRPQFAAAAKMILR